MRLSRLALMVAGTVLSTANFAMAVAPYTETFNTDFANWRQASSATNAIYTTSGGPDSTAYISSDYAFSSAAAPQVIIHRANDSANSSGDAFVGNWLSAGLNRFTAYVRHNVPQEMHYFLRLAQNPPAGAISFELPYAVQPNVWTKLDFDVSFANPFHTNESMDNSEAWFNGVLSNVVNMQLGIVIPNTLTNGTSASAIYRYDVDNAETSNVPEPASMLLSLAGLATISGVRRRSR